MGIRSIDSANTNTDQKKTGKTGASAAAEKKAPNLGKEANAADKVTLSREGLELSARMTKTAEKTRKLIVANPDTAVKGSGISDKGKVLSLLAE